MGSELRNLSLDQLKKQLKLNLILQVLIIGLAIALFTLIPLYGRYELFAIIMFLIIVRFMVSKFRGRINIEIKKRNDN